MRSLHTSCLVVFVVLVLAATAVAHDGTIRSAERQVVLAQLFEDEAQGPNEALSNYVVTITSSTNTGIIHRPLCARIDEPGMVVLGRYKMIEEAVSAVKATGRKPLLCNSEEWTAADYQTFSSLTGGDQAEQQSGQTKIARPTEAPSGFSLGLNFEKSLFALMSKTETEWKWTYDESGIPKLHFNFSDDGEMPVPSEFLVLLELGYRSKYFFALINYNLIPQKITDRLAVKDKDEDENIEGSVDFEERYTIEYSRIGFRAGYYFSDKPGRPYIQGLMGINMMKFEFNNDDIALEFEDITRIDIGFGGGYEYTIAKGFGLGGSADMRYMFGSFYGEYEYDNYDITSRDEMTINYQLLPLSVQFYLFYTF
ncbi:MAG: hypothetical protein P9M14_18405 [Candidatus Alcyoniella australis]|nr:hypothetical protein [Candidatus Alcyoniella australis]